ncbi:MAG: nucleotide exchange factor GrpE [Bryobacterales bacterium]|nr:nucleotide exchange factor GrpE [Bryobacterales bacterium]
MSTEPQEANVSETPETAVEDSAAVTDQAAALAELTAERDQLAADKAELQDQILRRQADFENFRRRTERERSEFVQYAGMELLRDVLPIADDFHRAVSSECVDTEYKKGIELIYGRLMDTLTRAGLEPIETQGAVFDPNLHQAVDRVESDEVADDPVVIAEYQPGYMFKGKLLRPAMVRVAVKAE